MMQTRIAAKTIGVEELKKRMESDTAVEVWNVMTDEYYHGELIPGSRRVPLDRIGRHVAGMAKETEIIVYCANSECQLSHMAAEKLAAFGFTNVRVYEGGVQEWIDSGNDLLLEQPVTI